MKRRLVALLGMALVLALVVSTAAMAAPFGKTVSNDLEVTVSVKPLPVAPTITVNSDLSLVTTVDLYDYFTVSTDPGTHVGETVRGKVELVGGDVSGFTLEYLEQQPGHPDFGKFLPMNFVNKVAWFGPSDGFPLLSVSDSLFRVTWNTGNAVYKFKVSIMGGEGFGTELATATATVGVGLGDAIILKHSIDGDATMVTGALEHTVNAGDTMVYSVSAHTHSVSHIDGMLYLIDVQKMDGDLWVAASPADFEIIAVDGSDDTEEINDTFAVEGDFLRGYWGPAQGFFFTGVSHPTDFTVEFTNAGVYKFVTYAIQVAPAATIEDMPVLGSE